MPQIHPCARTTPAVRVEIARSRERTGVLAQRYGVSTETVRKWRKRGPKDCLDHSARPRKLPWRATEEERAIVCTVRRATRFALDDLAERFNGRIEREVLTITVGSHRDLERLLKGYNQAYNARPQRVLKGGSPDDVVRSRLAEEPKLANPRHTARQKPIVRLI
jgi:transposase